MSYLRQTIHEIVQETIYTINENRNTQENLLKKLKNNIVTFI